METLFVRLNEVVWDDVHKKWGKPAPRTIRMSDVLGWKPWDCRDEAQRSSTPTEFTRFNYVAHIYDKDAPRPQKPAFFVVPMSMAQVDQMFEGLVLSV